jgi:hypothetical protein
MLDFKDNSKKEDEWYSQDRIKDYFTNNIIVS